MPPMLAASDPSGGRPSVGGRPLPVPAAPRPLVRAICVRPTLARWLVSLTVASGATTSGKDTGLPSTVSSL